MQYSSTRQKAKSCSLKHQSSVTSALSNAANGSSADCQASFWPEQLIPGIGLMKLRRAKLYWRFAKVFRAFANSILRYPISEPPRQRSLKQITTQFSQFI